MKPNKIKKKNTKVSESTSPNQTTHSCILFIHLINNYALLIVQSFIKMPIKSFNESIISTNHNEYPILKKPSNVSVRLTNHNGYPN
jgi:alanine dehydrogenase